MSNIRHRPNTSACSRFCDYRPFYTIVQLAMSGVNRKKPLASPGAFIVSRIAKEPNV
jgi:hypothetical protein